MNRKLFFACCGLFATSWLCCQQAVNDSIYLMNGQVVAEKVIDTTFMTVTIDNPAKPGKKINFDPEQLYMVRYANGRKRFYYTQDSLIGNIFTRNEMWMYMKGEKDARKGFKAPGSIIGGALAGLLGGMTGTIWGPVLPFGFMACTGITRVKIRHNTVSDPAYIDSDAYILGYERVSRQRRKISSLVAGAAGLVVGYSFYALFHNSYPEKVDIGFGGR
jgi:hypothetical protein